MANLTRIDPTSLASAYVSMSTVGATFKKGMPPEEFVAFLKNATRAEETMQLIIGDAIVYGEEEYPEEVYQYIADAEVKEGAVNNWAWIARAVPRVNRKNGLNFSHYRAVAKIEDKTLQGRLLREALDGEGGKPMTERAFKLLVGNEERAAANKRSRKAGTEEEGRYKLIKGRVRDIGEEELPDATIDMVFTDPPNARENIDTYEEVAAFAFRVLKPNGVLVMYASQDSIGDAVRLAGPFLNYVWAIAVPREKPVKVSPNRVTSNWRPALVFVKGDGLLNQMVDTINIQPGEDTTPTLQILDQFTLNDELIVDPYMSGGEILIEALQNGRRVVGIGQTKAEIENAQRAIAAIDDQKVTPEPRSRKKKEENPPVGKGKNVKEKTGGGFIAKPRDGGPGGKKTKSSRKKHNEPNVIDVEAKEVNQTA